MRLKRRSEQIDGVYFDEIMMARLAAEGASSTRTEQRSQ
jgi:hypothetical protein